ncbi:MAG: relaxase/mobilization nuclease domain-containing protein [Oscillospiraceae bacterium]|nr:relaxase/mobilization nuclease domain-containing protein [Oscillospiraceae bacterium]
MATTGIWNIKSRLEKVVDYTTNEEKTANKSFGKSSIYYELSDVIGYATDANKTDSNYYDLHQMKEYENATYKTEKQCYVTGINCTPEIASEEMLITKKQYNKIGGILGFHAFQSFKGHEVSPEEAHAIGVKLAEEVWGERFEVVVSTHLNTKNVHNHFVLNSVSFKDGKKYYDDHETYAFIRQTSDALCLEYNLSVLEEKPCENSKINYANFAKGYTQKSDFHIATKQDIDLCIRQADSYIEFEELLKRLGYQLTYRADKLSICREPYKRNIRVERNFGEDYTINRINERIATEKAVRIPFLETSHKKKYRLRGNIKRRKPLTGFQKLYLYYGYLLKIFPKQQYNKNKQITKTMRADIRKLKNISDGAKLLRRNNIETSEELFSYKNTLMEELENLISEKRHLWYEHKKANRYEQKVDIVGQIDILSNKIKWIRKEVGLCEDIETRVPKIKEDIKEINEKQEKIQRREKEK